MAGTIGGVPASNLPGKSAGSKPSSRTRRIMPPPPKNGGIASSSSRLPYSTPTPEGPSILWPLKARKSASQGLHVGPAVRHALRRIDQHDGPGRVGPADDFGHGIDRAQHVGNRRHGDQPRPLVEQPVELVEPQPPDRRSRRMCRSTAPVRAANCCQGTRLAVVLHFGQQHLVAGAQIGVAPAAGDQVDALGRAVGEDHLFVAAARR